MKKATNFLDGKKTYILGTIALIIIGANLFGLISNEVANTFLGVIGFGGLVTLRAGIAKSK